MNNTDQGHLVQLPLVLGIAEGEIDLSMNQDLFVDKISTLSRRVGDLVDHYTKMAHNKQQDAYQRVADCLADRAFREHWHLRGLPSSNLSTGSLPSIHATRQC